MFFQVISRSCFLLHVLPSFFLRGVADRHFIIFCCHCFAFFYRNRLCRLQGRGGTGYWGDGVMQRSCKGGRGYRSVCDYEGYCIDMTAAWVAVLICEWKWGVLYWYDSMGCCINLCVKIGVMHWSDSVVYWSVCDNERKQYWHVHVGYSIDVCLNMEREYYWSALFGSLYWSVCDNAGYCIDLSLKMGKYCIDLHMRATISTWVWKLEGTVFIRTCGILHLSFCIQKLWSCFEPWEEWCCCIDLTVRVTVPW